MRKRDLVDGVVGPRTRETVDSLLCMKGMTNAEKVDFLMSRNRELRAENHHMQAETKALRELVRDLYECASHANEQDWFYFERHMLGCGMSCTVNGEGCGLSVLADRLRELGVEVES